MTTESGRRYLEAAVAERASHRSAEDVRVTCSFARAERLLGREYHGRFLIELLQNAADAWGADPRSGSGDVTTRSKVAVVLAEGPALLVANQGAPLPAQVVIDSIGHIGASTKSEGEAIGHKGIGFKSVLELTLAPELYSGLQEPKPELAAVFDPELALELIRDSTRGPVGEGWDDLVATVEGLDHDDELAGVPVLRFPRWVEELPADVRTLADEGFDTVVRLPFRPEYVERLGLSEAMWIDTVRRAVRDITDQIVLLLGCFDEIRFENRRLGAEPPSVEIVKPTWQDEAVVLADGVTREVVAVERNGAVSSRWRLYRRALPDAANLAGEIAVGIRLQADVDGHPSSRDVVLPAVDDEPSAPFHLFFPTRIPSGLPFLLHGYFEVDAARTGFYRGSSERNTIILGHLAALAADAVRDSADREAVDFRSLVDLVACAPEPGDALAQQFRRDVLAALDRVAWIPLTASSGDGSGRARPAEVLVARPQVTRLLARTFPPNYVTTRVALSVPDEQLSDAALGLVADRQPRDQLDLWETVELLCRPGELDIWETDAADRGFAALLDLFSALEVEDRDAVRSLVSGLRASPDSRLLPAVGAGGSRVLLPVPDPDEGVSGRRSQLVMARVRAADTAALVPPPALDLAFLTDGLLGSEQEIDRAKPFGVRPFTVDNVLDRLNGIGSATTTDEDKAALFRFLWLLLVRERVSGFGTRRGAERAALFDPSQWFWCQPGRAREDETARLRQQRERYLAEVPVPCRDGVWRPAGRVAFGQDWAEWIETGELGAALSGPNRERIEAYRALEAVSPGKQALLAAPDVVGALLGDDAFDPSGFVGSDEDTGAAVDDDARLFEAGHDLEDEGRRNGERHAFLLRLGVWEVPPLDAFESRDPAGRTDAPFPWPSRTAPSLGEMQGARSDQQIADLQRSSSQTDGRWEFGLEDWGGRQHHNVYLGEDYRFSWSLDEMATRDPHALVAGLRLGARLYGERRTCSVFCTGCSDSSSSHRAWRHSTAGDGFPSWAALELRHRRWVPCTSDGVPVDAPMAAAEVWWHPHPPTGAGLRQSAWRLLPVCGPGEGLTDDLRRLAGINTLEDADPDTVERLLVAMKEQYEQGSLPVDPLTSGSAHQAFLGIHRLAYERLAELAPEQPEAVAAVLERTGLLCELGDTLVHRPVGEARHDNGRFASYVRYFVGVTPFAVLPRDREVAASRLGIEPFRIDLQRQGDDDGRDVTDEVRTFLGDRIAALLSIMVHHSLGAQTLEVTSNQFEERARRLGALSVRQMDDLVVIATEQGSGHQVTIGVGADRDLFLEGPTSPAPVLFHDLVGVDWKDRLRRRIAPHLAAVLENPAYNHTLALFLQADSDAEREEFLLELGITGDEVDAIAARIGVVSEEEQLRHRRWFTAVFEALGYRAPGSDLDLDLDPAVLVAELQLAGLSAPTAQRLVEAGGGEAVRRQTEPDAPLRLLVAEGVDLKVLHDRLRHHDDPGLSIGLARRAFARWLDTHGRRLAVVLAGVRPPDEAKALVRALQPPPAMEFHLEPPVGELLSPVIEALRADAFSPEPSALVARPEDELLRLAELSGPLAMDERIALLFDAEERHRVLRMRAGEWRRETLLLAVLSRTGPADTRTTIRATDERVDATLLVNPTSPSALRSTALELFTDHEGITAYLGEHLVDTLDVEPPDREQLLAVARADGVAVNGLERVLRALVAPARDRARALKARAERLAKRGVGPVAPTGLMPAPPPGPGPAPGPKKVAAVKVGESHDKRKKELGDEGELWALAAVVRHLTDLHPDQLDAAIDDILDLLERFEGKPVDAVRGHADPVRSRGLDEEELIDELTGLLHVSQHSDAFGFDLLGWLPDKGSKAPSGGHAVCLEVKSSGGEGFHLSTGEWGVAQRLHQAGVGHQYAVLVVRRAKTGGVPAGMDLLADPVHLHRTGQLRLDVDGYKVVYSTLAGIPGE